VRLAASPHRDWRAYDVVLTHGGGSQVDDVNGVSRILMDAAATALTAPHQGLQEFVHQPSARLGHRKTWPTNTAMETLNTHLSYGLTLCLNRWTRTVDQSMGNGV